MRGTQYPLAGRCGDLFRYTFSKVPTYGTTKLITFLFFNYLTLPLSETYIRVPNDIGTYLTSVRYERVHLRNFRLGDIKNRKTFSRGTSQPKNQMP